MLLRFLLNEFLNLAFGHEFILFGKVLNDLADSSVFGFATRRLALLPRFQDHLGDRGDDHILCALFGLFQRQRDRGTAGGGVQMRPRFGSFSRGGPTHGTSKTKLLYELQVYTDRSGSCSVVYVLRS